MSPQEQREDLVRFTLSVAYETFAPGMEVEKFLEELMMGGFHHELLHKLVPGSDDLEGDAYWDALGEFEGDLGEWVEQMKENHDFYKSIDGLPGKVRGQKMNKHHAAQAKKYHWLRRKDA